LDHGTSGSGVQKNDDGRTIVIERKIKEEK
jgi:hypothetical protein